MHHNSWYFESLFNKMSILVDRYNRKRYNRERTQVFLSLETLTRGKGDLLGSEPHDFPAGSSDGYPDRVPRRGSIDDPGSIPLGSMESNDAA